MTKEKAAHHQEEEEITNTTIETGCLLVKIPGSPKAYAVVMSPDKMNLLLLFAGNLCNGPMTLAPFEGVHFKSGGGVVAPVEEATDRTALIYHQHYAGAKSYADQEGLKHWSFLRTSTQLKGIKDKRVIVLGRHMGDTVAEEIIMEAKLRCLELSLIEVW